MCVLTANKRKIDNIEKKYFSISPKLTKSSGQSIDDYLDFVNNATKMAENILKYTNQTIQTLEKNFNSAVEQKNNEILIELKSIINKIENVRNFIKKNERKNSFKTILIALNTGIDDLEEYYEDLNLAINLLPKNKEFNSLMKKASLLSKK